MTCLRSHRGFESLLPDSGLILSLEEQQSLRRLVLNMQPSLSSGTPGKSHQGVGQVISIVLSTSHMLPLSLWETLLSDPGSKEKCGASIIKFPDIVSLFNLYINFHINENYQNLGTSSVVL